MKYLSWLVFPFCILLSHNTGCFADKKEPNIEKPLAQQPVVEKDTNEWKAKKLIAAYPEHLDRYEDKHIVWKDGTKMLFDDGIKNKTFQQLLDAPDLEDQMYMAYPKGKSEPPAKFHDPGRVRYEPFFFKMYGASQSAVEKNLVSISWLPKTLGIPFRVTKVNGVDKKLQAVANELDSLLVLHKYLKNPGGTFAWRKIAGTNRMSTHSFGTTIDINVAFSDYWQWSCACKNEDVKDLPYKNRIPLEIVEIFEKHGFIWGGKWWHYDTMHFEYRPELL